MTKFVDSIQMPKRKTSRPAPKQEPPVFAREAAREPAVAHGFSFAQTLRQGIRALLFSKVALFFILVSFVIPLSAFEAHVVNVTATIERRPSSCDARSPGYWRNHEGCTSGGGGSSVWASEVNTLSATFSSVFGTYTGEQICQAVDSCPGGNSIASKRCRATRHTLADELNVVSSHQDPNALVAGADDGSSAFDNLGLNSNSTVGQALATVEAILGNAGATAAELTDAATVAQRIYGFYEDENSIRPACVYSWDGTNVQTSGNAVIIEANILETLLFGGDEDGDTDDVSSSTEPTAASTESVVASTEPAATSTEPVATSTEEIAPQETPTSTEPVVTSTENIVPPENGPSTEPAVEPPPSVPETPPSSSSESPPPSEPPPAESPAVEPPPAE